MRWTKRHTIIQIHNKQAHSKDLQEKQWYRKALYRKVSQMDREGPFGKMPFEAGPGRSVGTAAEVQIEHCAERSSVQRKIPIWLKELCRRLRGWAGQCGSEISQSLGRGRVWSKWDFTQDGRYLVGVFPNITGSICTVRKSNMHSSAPERWNRRSELLKRCRCWVCLQNCRRIQAPLPALLLSTQQICVGSQ